VLTLVVEHGADGLAITPLECVVDLFDLHVVVAGPRGIAAQGRDSCEHRRATLPLSLVALELRQFGL
jgi:hypothetical protein